MSVHAPTIDTIGPGDEPLTSKYRRVQLGHVAIGEVLFRNSLGHRSPDPAIPADPVNPAHTQPGVTETRDTCLDL
ncbi:MULTISPECIES: hypothetical protein [unclassified Streptomyces]|uniref:hypothetical protein n=1 Tax=unclassified Streptomyces TaxID=2593676 RepID=UPI0036EB1C15